MRSRDGRLPAGLVLILGLALTFGGGLFAETSGQCISYEPYLHWVGGIDLGGHAEHIAVSGDLALLADDVLGLLIIDISDPLAPYIIGTEGSIREVRDLATDGELAVAVGDPTLLTVIDVTNPASPVVRGTAETLGQPFGVALYGNYCYVADYGSGLLIYDLTFPEHPELVGVRSTPGDTYGVEVDGTWAYVAGGLQGFHLVDVSDPQQPVIRGSVSTGGIAWRVRRHGNDVYVGDRAGSLHAFDISFPATPQLRSSADTPGGMWDVTVGQHFAFVADGGWGVHVINIGDPDNLRSVGSTEIPGFAYDVGLSGNYVLVAAGDAGLQVVRASGLPQVSPVASVDTPAWVNAVAVRRGIVCTANSDAGLRLYDVSNPVDPQVAGILPMTYASGVAMQGWHAYVTDDSRSVLTVANVSDPLNPWAEVELELPGNARRIVLSDTLALVAAANAGLQIVDISDFLAPQIIGALDDVYASDVAISDQRAYLSSLTSVRVVDFSDPTAPEQLGALTLEGRTSSIAATGNYAYVATDYGGLQIVDATNPRALELVAEVPSFGPVSDVVAAGAHVYFVDRVSDGAGLHIVNVTVPAEPVLVGRTAIPNGAASLAVYGSYIYTGKTSGESGLRIYRAQCGGVTPVLATDFEAWPQAGGIRLRWFLHGDCFRAFEISRAAGRQVPAESHRPHLWLPEETGTSVPGPREILDLQVAPGRWYSYRIAGHLADGEVVSLGQITARAASGGRISLAPARPNPAASVTALTLELDRRGDVRLELFDVAGRRVRTLLQGSLPPGAHEIPWDGCDEHGRRVPAGTYWARLAAGHQLAGARILMVR